MQARTSTVDPVEVVVKAIALLIVLIVLILGFFFNQESYYDWEMKCLSYRDTPTKNIPDNCVGYWKERR